MPQPDEFFRKLENEMANVSGGDGLIEIERRIYYRGLAERESGISPEQSKLTEAEWVIWQTARVKITEAEKRKNNPNGVVVNIRPGVLLKVRRSSGKIEDG